MTDSVLLARLALVRDIPTLPQVIAQVQDAIDDKGSSAQDLTGILESDHAIAARVLRLANSAFLGLSHRVDTIRRAVVILGFDSVHHLALSTAVFDTLSRQRQFALDAVDFWMHSFGAAKAAQLLSARVSDVPSHGSCFTAALLHDIGKYLFALVLGEQYRGVVTQAAKSGRPIRVVEKQRLGVTHQEAGGWILDRWRFPPLIVGIVENLHLARTYAGAHRPQIVLVALAAGLSWRAGFGSAGEPGEARLDPQLLEALELSADDAGELIEVLQAAREDARRFLEVMAQGE